MTDPIDTLWPKIVRAFERNGKKGMRQNAPDPYDECNISQREACS